MPLPCSLFSGTALAVSGNPENPDASTKNWQLDELRQSVNNQFSDVNNRIDQIQAGSGFDASDIYDRLDTHDKQIGVLNNATEGLQKDFHDLDQAVTNLEESHRYTHDLVKEMGDKVQHTSDLADGANAKAEEANKNALDAKSQAVEAQNTANKADYKADAALRDASDALRQNSAQDAQIADLQATKADRSELEEVAIKADGALAGAIENRNQIDVVKENLADANRNITKGIQNNLESQGKAEEKRAGNWFNR